MLLHALFIDDKGNQIFKEFNSETELNNFKEQNRNLEFIAVEKIYPFNTSLAD